MSELIDRQALLDECLNHYEVGNIEQNCTMDWICKTVRNFPAASPWHRAEDELPEPNIQCLVRDDDNNCAVGYYRQDARAWDSPFFGWVERGDEYYEDGDLCRIGKVVAWMSIEPPKE